ncbi:UDP-N-acetylglucosamine 2-epimerase [Tepidicaulis sp. LMO-SS28]|uniref:UDP-N-acetylglucosamine 2-epimerase n=1 Tax=Tepidicaulis sp. LMO-SS28 TaxID=3447455 RepID=UPI003EE3593A
MTAERRIAVVTGSRAEYGLLHRLIGLLHRNPAAALQLVVTGTHLSPAHGLTVREIEEDGFPIAAKVDLELGADDAVGIAAAMGRGLAGFGAAFAQLRPDLVVVLGDRFEMLAAAEAAMLARLPIAHIHGGEASEGQIDEAIRHALTKMAHFHFVAADPYRRRVIQMGEEPARVFNVGAPGLDLLLEEEEVAPERILGTLGIEGEGPLFLVTYHPVTLEERAERDAEALTCALDAFPEARIVFTGVNADTSGYEIEAALQAYVARHPGRAALVTSLGRKRYASVLRAADAVIGNSSSGIIEAPIAGTPTVNIGPRQQGRLRAPSVIDCNAETPTIRDAIARALSGEMRSIAARKETPYGAGGASQRIHDLLLSLPLEGVLMKRFYEMGASA